MESGKRASSLSKIRNARLRMLFMFLDQAGLIRSIQSYEDAFNNIKKDYDIRIKDHNKSVKATQKRLSNLFGFMEQPYGEGREMLIVVTELPNKHLLVYNRRLEIEQELKKYKLDQEGRTK